MFFTLLLVTFVIATVVSIAVVQFFEKSISQILHRIVADELAEAWVKYIKFAAYVVGVSGGVRVYSLEQYVNGRFPGQVISDMSSEAWALEVYRTLIGTLQSLAWVLLIVFLFALIAFVFVRVFEIKAEHKQASYRKAEADDD